ELFESYLNAVFTQKGDGWVEKKLGDADLIQIVDGDRGVNYPKKADFSNEGFCLFLNTKNVRPDGFNFESTMFITKEKDRALRKGKLKHHDVLLTTRGTIGNIALYDDSVDFDEIRINSGMLIFRPNERIILSEYLFEIFRSGIMKSQIDQFVSGAAQPQLPIKTLVNFSIPVPTKLADQKKIVVRLHKLSTETKRLEVIYQKKLTALAELKQSILQKAFAGKLTARPEKALDEAVA
ncbi:MAG: restriction endonuclease subunit S, partial [Deltaproteobacteria bacterium]|nr:restriction endonuclease subunit S [Deltaproteobacteria bacterium]